MISRDFWHVSLLKWTSQKLKGKDFLYWLQNPFKQSTQFFRNNWNLHYQKWRFACFEFFLWFFFFFSSPFINWTTNCTGAEAVFHMSFLQRTVLCYLTKVIQNNLHCSLVFKKVAGMVAVLFFQKSALTNIYLNIQWILEELSVEKNLKTSKIYG